MEPTEQLESWGWSSSAQAARRLRTRPRPAPDTDSSHVEGGPGVALLQASSSSIISESLDSHSAFIDTVFNGSGEAEFKPEVT